MKASTASLRSVSRIVEGVEHLEGEGFLVHRPFPSHDLSHIDPFLLLDEMGPMDLAPGEAKGAPDHPHRGFETVTYMLEGRFRHKDSHGHSGKIDPGDVQWMTAGAGVVHSEMPEEEFALKGGRMHGSQLWVNLPRSDKMIPPHYQEVPASKIPEGRTEDGRVTVRVIAGESLGAHAVIETRTPIMYLHFTLQPGARFEQPVPDGYNVFAYVIEGEGRFGPDGRLAQRGQLALFFQDGSAITMQAAEKGHGPLGLFLIGGRPLNEPVARYGPFVMNTAQELQQAFDDYRNGRMGAITH